MKMKVWLEFLMFFSKFLQILLASGGFIVAPGSRTVHEGNVAVFRCRHSDADHITWSVNGMSVSLDAPDDINPGLERDRDNNFVDSLNITASSTNNNSQVVCVATIGSESVSSPPAILTVLPRTSSLTGFTTTPQSQNITVGASVQFTCRHTDGDTFWRINGEMVDGLPGVTTSSERGLHVLQISNASIRYNESMIQCRADFEDRSQMPDPTPSAKLLLQGPLESVGDVHLDRNSSTLSWTSLFSLDLTGVDPDIVYCVEVYNITCGRRDLIISDCNVTEPSYTIDDIALDGYIYEYTVTPRSNVEGARNGIPSEPLREEFSTSSRFLVIRNATPTGGNFRFAFNNLGPSQLLPTFLTLVLDSTDDLEDFECRAIIVSKEGNVVVYDANCRLPSHRVWNCTLFAYNCTQNGIVAQVELSTHGVQNVSISSPLPGQVRVTGYFIQGSTASGVLISFINKTSSLHHTVARKSGENEIEGVILGLVRGEYTVSVFVLEKSGVPFERAATRPRKVFVEYGSRGGNQLSAIEYTLKSTSTSVCVDCTFLDVSTTACVVVIHQRISQLSSSGLMNIVSSHKFNRSGDAAYGCIEKKLEACDIGVIDGKLVTNDKQVSVQSDHPLYVAVSVVLVAMFIFLSVVLIVIVLRKIRKNRTCSRVKENDDKLFKSEEGSDRRSTNLYLPMPTENSEVLVQLGQHKPLLTAGNEGEKGDENPQDDELTPNVSTAEGDVELGEVVTCESTEVGANPVIMEESMPIFKEEETDTIAHDASIDDSDDELTPNVSTAEGDVELGEVVTCKSAEVGANPVIMEESMPIFKEEESDTIAHDATIDDSVKVANDITSTDTENEEQVEDMTSTNQVLSGIKECAKDAEEESKTAFFSRDGIALAEPIGHSTPQKQQSLSNGGDEVELSIAHSLPSEDAHLFIQNSQVHERVPGHDVRKSLTYCTSQEDSTTKHEEAGASENSTCPSAPQSRLETETDDQKGHEPVGDSGCYTLSTPGDFECQSTLSEPYSTVGYINEPGDSRMDTKGTPVQIEEGFVSGCGNTSSSNVQDCGSQILSSPMFTRERMGDQRRTKPFTKCQEEQPRDLLMLPT